MADAPQVIGDRPQNSLVTVLGLVGVQGVSQPLLEKRSARGR